MKRKIAFQLLLLFVILSLLIGCEGKSTLEEPENSVQDSWDFHVPDGKVMIKMDLSNVIAIPRTSSRDYYLIYEDITKGDSLKYTALESSEASLVLEKGGIYVIGLAQRLENEKPHIEVLGILGDEHYGLICFPIGEDASEIIDLGKLVKDGEVLKTSIPPEDFSEMLGYDEELLRQISIVDVTFQNFLNPDVDRDGVMDVDQNLRWWITLYYGFNLDGETIEKDRSRFVFWMDIEYVKEKYGEDFAMTYDYDSNYTGREGVATLTHLNSGETYELGWSRIEDGKYYQWYFEVPEYLDGDYVLTVEGSKTGKTYEFFFENLRFYHPEETLKGLLILYPKVTAYSDGKIKDVSWEWRLYSNSSADWEKPRAELLKMLANMGNGPVYFYFANSDQFFSWAPGHFSRFFIPTDYGLNPFEDQSYDLSSENYWVQPGPVLSVVSRADFQMIGNNDVYYQAKYLYEKFPSGFDSEKFSLVENEEDLDGIWYNLYIYSQNSDRDLEKLSMESGDLPAEVDFDAESKTYRIYWTFFNEDDLEERIVSEGKYEVSEGLITLHLYEGEDVSINASVSEKSLILKLGSEEVVYSLYKRISVDEAIWRSPNSPAEYEGLWVHEGEDAAFQKIEIYDVENSDENNDGYFEGYIRVFQKIQDDTPADEGTILIDEYDLSSITTFLENNGVYNVRAYFSEDGEYLKLSLSEGEHLIYVRTQ